MGDVRSLIVFDLDGTLIDSRQDLTNAANALIVERGGEPLPADTVGSMVGDGAARLVSRALIAAGLPLDDGAVTRFLELYDDRLLETTRLYPSVRRTLETLASGGAALAVLTNKPLAPARRLLSALAVERLFGSTIGGDGPLPRKPDPTSLRFLMDQHTVAPSGTVLVGDSRIDLETARRAGVGICLARYGFGYGTLAAEPLRGDEMVVDHAADIAAVVARFLQGQPPPRSA
jgi:phosphoglycolate phosphatase